MKKISLYILSTILILALAAYIFSIYQFRDRHPNYWVDIDLQSSQNNLLAGFAKVDISPTIPDTWIDVNGDFRYNPVDGDTYTDGNGNGQFDGVWLAGFHNSRPAQGVLDPLWARAMVLDAGDVKMALVVIDMIGFGNDEVIATRKMILNANPWLDYVIISSTHVHSSPDLMGMWGPSEYKRGVDPAYLLQVQEGIRDAVKEAFGKVRPAFFRFSEENDKLKPLVGDSREPQVFDAGLRLMQVIDSESFETLGTIMNWGNHPETLWSQNIQVSSDFAHHWREFVENGIVEKDSVLLEGVGGIAIFLNGAIGGLMTTHPSMEVKDPYTNEKFLEQGLGKIIAQGRALAKITLETLHDSNYVEVNRANLSIRAETIELRMDNNLFHLAAYLGVFDRGFTKWKHIRSEVSAWKLGPATFVHVPGELYPEILYGGIESPTGADFGIYPVEVPAIHTQILGQFKFFAGMSNDMIGYIVPKSQWDEAAPFTYINKKRPYGEVNSLGPETAPKIHSSVLKILQEIK
ncbi:hypothetical protein [Algoriphagus ratkowskyi]|nr:hypothetical protein [Algoriphagus ratkowskyi]TXD79662.1 hypothetical protein ESW18_00590 [Algoriphagus ratkowskyi]